METSTFKTVTSRMKITEIEYDEFLVMAAGLLGIPVPSLAESEIRLSIYDSRHDLDDPEDERCIELDLCVETNPRTASQ